MEFRCMAAALSVLLIITIGGTLAQNSVNQFSDNISAYTLRAEAFAKAQEHEKSAAELAALVEYLDQKQTTMCMLSNHNFWEMLKQEAVRAIALVEAGNSDELFATLKTLPLLAEQIANRDRLCLSNIF